MSDRDYVAEATVEIEAAPVEVWDALTQPARIREYMSQRARRKRHVTIPAPSVVPLTQPGERWGRPGALSPKLAWGKVPAAGALAEVGGRGRPGGPGKPDFQISAVSLPGTPRRVLAGTLVIMSESSQSPVVYRSKVRIGAGPGADATGLGPRPGRAHNLRRPLRGGRELRRVARRLPAGHHHPRLRGGGGRRLTDRNPGRRAGGAWRQRKRRQPHL